MNPEDLIRYHGPDEVVHFTDYLLNRATAKDAKRFGSSFRMFDEASGGLETGEVVVITGHTKNGKTLFAESWINAMALSDPQAKAAIFSFEVQPERMLLKYPKEKNFPLYVPSQLKTMDYAWLFDRCAEAKFKYNCRIILIDHLHFLVDMSTKQNMSLNIGAFMRRVKQEIALGLDMAVLIIAHQGQPKEKQEASLSNMRDSSFIGQESDTTIVVSRRKDFDEVEVKDYESKYQKVISNLFSPGKRQSDEYSQGLATIKIECHRRTGVFDWRKTFRKNGHFLEEL